MAKSCIHFCPCKTGVSVAHNTREKKSIREQVIGSSIPNESFYYTSESLTKIKNRCKKDYESTPRITGKNRKAIYRKAQRNFAPIKEAVVLIKEETTMDDLKELCQEIHNTYDIIPLQIHVHRDEGYIDEEGKAHYNLHAHIVFQFYQFDKHANHQHNWVGCTVMQDIVSEKLKMERGISSNLKHLTPIQYKLMAEQKKLERTTKQKEAEEQMIATMEEIFGTDEEIAQYTIEECNHIISVAHKRIDQILVLQEALKREKSAKESYGNDSLNRTVESKPDATSNAKPGISSSDTCDSEKHHQQQHPQPEQKKQLKKAVSQKKKSPGISFH